MGVWNSSPSLNNVNLTLALALSLEPTVSRTGQQNQERVLLDMVGRHMVNYFLRNHHHWSLRPWRWRYTKRPVASPLMYPVSGFQGLML